jgi:hypothetical protein
MLIDSFVPNPDAVETHRIHINASPDVVYRALRTADLGSSLVIKFLLALRSLPEFILHPRSPLRRDRRITLRTLIDAGFGELAEHPGRNCPGVSGRFWCPTGNLSTFNRVDFDAPVPAGRARAVWNFHVEEGNDGQTILSTHTRVICGDARSRRKFRAYWFFVRPFSGLIRRLMLRAVRQTSVCRNLAKEFPQEN